MNTETLLSTNTLLKITGLDIQFERLLDGMIFQVRHALGVPQPGPDQDPQVEEEFTRLKERLRTFFPEYQQTFHELLLKYLGERQLVASASAMSSEPVVQYFAALREMEPELTARLRDLSQRMGETELQSS